MPAPATHPRTFARQLRDLAAALEADGCRLTPAAREELGLEPGRPELTPSDSFRPAESRATDLQPTAGAVVH